MSNDLEKGFYPVEENIPYSVQEIGISRYMFLKRLGRTEQEEAAGRIVQFSLRLDSWVGVSVSKIMEMIKEDYDLHAEREKIMDVVRADFAKERASKAEVEKYQLYCRRTLGIYGLFNKAPENYTAPKTEVPELPFSMIYVFGPDSVFKGIWELIDKGLLKLVKTMEDGIEKDILYPTAALIAKAI